MQTRISTKGQVVLPSPIRRKLDLRAGDKLDANVEGGRVILTPRRQPSRKGKIIKDPVTGLPVFSVEAGSPILTSKQVKEILSNFP